MIYKHLTVKNKYLTIFGKKFLLIAKLKIKYSNFSSLDVIATRFDTCHNKCD